MCRLESGADASLQDADGQTALDKAVAQVGSVLMSLIREGTSYITLSLPHWYAAILGYLCLIFIQGHAQVTYLLRHHAQMSHR